MLRGAIRGTNKILAPQKHHARVLRAAFRPLVMPSYPFPARKRLAQVTDHLVKNMSSISTTPATASGRSSSEKRRGGGEMGDEPKVLTLLEGNTSTILLNRPKALNALDAEMIEMIDEALDSTPPHTHIVLRGNGRALCSGGDVLAVVTAANSEDPQVRKEALSFFEREFQLDYRIATLEQGKSPRTFISIMDGITMGGGVGLSIHAPIRVATEKTLFAMPETGIGYFPDVGVTRCLARLDGKVGQYLGMTGSRISGEEAYFAGIATHFIPSSSISAALQRLSTLPPDASTSRISQTLDDFSIDPFNKDSHGKADEINSKSALFGSRRIALDYCFGQADAETVYRALVEVSSGSIESASAKELVGLGVDTIRVKKEEQGAEEEQQLDSRVTTWAKETISFMNMKSPRSLTISLKAINEARKYDVAEAFQADIRLATAFCDLSVGRDFYEGVTHTLKKDPNTGKRREGRANWDPKALDQVDEAKVQSIFFGSTKQAEEAGLSIKVPVLNRVPTLSQDRDGIRQRAESIKGVGPLGWEKSYNTQALPSEAEMEALREGSHPAAGNYEMTEEELIDTMRNVKNDKAGIDLKVKEWWQRRQLKAKR